MDDWEKLDVKMGICLAKLQTVFGPALVWQGEAGLCVFIGV